MPSSEYEARARDGARLAYTLYDHPASGQHVVLVHSLAMDRSFWRPVAARLAANACVLTPDCRGHGRSAKPEGSVTVERHADDVADLMDQLGWRSALVAGASMGGCIALACAIRHPGRVSALGLVDTTAWYGPDAPKNWEQRANAALASGLSSLTDFQVTRWFGDKFRADNPRVVKECVDIFLRNDVAAYAQTCRMLGACDLRAGLASIKVPTAIVVGDEDYATPPTMAEAMHNAIAGSTLSVLPGARHLTPLERPEQIAAELDRLLHRARVAQ
ncbi:MAG TPA: alpha/beta fold hydrolase [Xanthobacteraceae bacterium]|jgi:3-oxoadipate enol-lactonase|nr:alpha/beta fold hydrolase [Xanthobacteraceae bacterium]